MTDAPERIWAGPADIFDGVGIWQDTQAVTEQWPEYIRADLADISSLRTAALRLAEAAERYADQDAELDRALRNLNYALTGGGK